MSIREHQRFVAFGRPQSTNLSPGIFLKRRESVDPLIPKVPAGADTAMSLMFPTMASNTLPIFASPPTGSSGR